MLQYSDSVRCGDRRIDYLATVDGTLLGNGHGPTKGDAQEVAAGMTLATLLPSHDAENPG